MPTYEYECTKCGTVFEMFQPITEAPRRRLKKSDPKPCDCNAKVLRHIGAGAGIIFKGSGFYQTDYRSENYKKAAKAEKTAAEGKSKSDKKGGDAKSKTSTTPGKTESGNSKSQTSTSGGDKK